MSGTTFEVWLKPTFQKYTGDKWTMLRWHCTVIKRNYTYFYGSSSLIKDEADGEARRSNGAFLLDPPTLPVPLTVAAATIGLYT